MGNDYKWMDLHGGRIVTNIDEYFHRICNHFAEIRWKDFPEDGTDDLHLYQYYYAEDELYVIKSNISDMIAFERAKSPIDALRSLEDKMERKSNSLVFINYEGEE